MFKHLGTNLKRLVINYRWLATIVMVAGLFTIIGLMMSSQLDKNRVNHSVKQPTPKTPRPTPTPVARSASAQYGIAAGGGLIFLDQNELDSYFQQLKELGVKWVRWDIDWNVIQANGPTSYNWTGTDRVVETARQYNINSLGTIAYTPVWARPSACKESDKCAPADATAFGDFAKKVAARYRPQGIRHWEIWNEPNHFQFWQPTSNPSFYAVLLKSAYEAIKKSDPEAVVLSGGLAAVGDENNDIAPVVFIQRLYEAGVADNFDGIAVHPYTFPARPSHPAAWNSWQQLNQIRQLMIIHGDSSKLIWITEYGAPTGGPGRPRETNQFDDFVYGQDYMTEDSQVVIIDEALRLAFQIEDWLGPFFWYSLKDEGTSKSTPENFFGLLRFDGSKKPAYYQFQSAIEDSK